MLPGGCICTQENRAKQIQNKTKILPGFWGWVLSAGFWVLSLAEPQVPVSLRGGKLVAVGV